MPIPRVLTPSIALLALLAASCELEPAAVEDDLGEAEAPRPVVVDPAKELVITDPSVIHSALETTFDPQHPSGVSAKGAWTFGRLVHNMLPREERDSPEAASAFVFAWLATWELDQRPNPGVSPAAARTSIRLMITDPWRAASGCDLGAPDVDCVLDMAEAPFDLIAIVNRPDLRITANDGTAIGGEGRFVFQVRGPTLGIRSVGGPVEVMDPTIARQKFTVIFEYSLPISSPVETLTWATRWHQLGALRFGPGFNGHLRSLTSAFAGPDRDPRRPNGNALDQLRTNEVALQGARFPAAGFVGARQVWELREFHLTPSGLTPHTVNLEPARDFDVAKAGQTGAEGSRTADLIAYLLADAPAILTGRNRLPTGLSGNSSLVGSAPYGAWGKTSNPNPPTIPSSGVAHALPGVDIAVRDAFALGTCAGCHRHETDTRHFMHITAVGAMEVTRATPLVDDRARIGAADAPDDLVVLSNLLRADIAPGGGRHEDFRALLSTSPSQLADRPGLRVCAE